MDNEKKIDMGSLMEQHRMEFPIPTRLGLIILRHVPFVKQMELICESMEEDPDYADILDDIEALRTMMKYPMAKNDLSIQRDLEEKVNRIKPHLNKIRILCFKQPVLRTSEEYDALINNLLPDERDHISNLVVTLTAPLPTMELNANAIKLIQQFNIPLANDLTGENLTMHQAVALGEAIKPPGLEPPKEKDEDA